jgi:DivIVA domain-containing protein
MELTPQTLRAVEFHARLRGYDMAEVDTFLAEVAAALEDFLATPLGVLEAGRTEPIGVENPIPAIGSPVRRRREVEAGAARIRRDAGHQSREMILATQIARQNALARLDQLRA